ncbi:unnamed protein product [Orchesella dallaii]|uniref:BTB domain-containing protein n=1 Tax=Orchesella dallaii TaxID=48710 RepID=A0ABP1QL65_9HEXA
MSAPLQIKPISEARGKTKMSSIPDTAVPILKTVRNMFQHAEYKYVWSTDLLESSGSASGVEQINGDTNGLGWKHLCTYKCIKNTPSFHLRATIWTLGELKEGDSDLLPRKDLLSFTPDNFTRHSLCNDMASLWHEKRSEWTDMVIQVGYRNFPVHRAILAGI